MQMHQFMSTEYFVSIPGYTQPNQPPPLLLNHLIGSFVECKNFLYAYNSNTNEQLLFQHCHYCQHQHCRHHHHLGPLSSRNNTITIISSWSSAVNFQQSAEHSQFILSLPTDLATLLLGKYLTYFLRCSIAFKISESD